MHSKRLRKISRKFQVRFLCPVNRNKVICGPSERYLLFVCLFSTNRKLPCCRFKLHNGQNKSFQYTFKQGFSLQIDRTKFRSALCQPVRFFMKLQNSKKRTKFTTFVMNNALCHHEPRHLRIKEDNN